MLRIAVVDLLSNTVELRRAMRETRERSVRRKLRSVEFSLRQLLGPSVPKTRAAQALGVSVTALDRWIDRGVLPVVARKGSSRLEVETGPLLELLDQVTLLRAQGLRRSVVAAAVARLRWRDDPEGRRVLSEHVAALPRPNVSARELREYYKRTTPEERVAEVSRLSAAATAIAAAATGDA